MRGKNARTDEFPRTELIFPCFHAGENSKNRWISPYEAQFLKPAYGEISEKQKESPSNTLLSRVLAKNVSCRP